MAIVAAESVSGFFEEIVSDSLRRRQLETTNAAANYIVAILSDYAKPDSLAGAPLERPLAFLLDEALRMPNAAERFDRLRILGDGILYGCGFFGDHFEARGVEKAYLVGIGSTAYNNASTILRSQPTKTATPPMDIFGELASKFAEFASVLADVADATVAFGTTSSQSVLKAYERWLKTGSDRLAQSLAVHGLVATRGPGGLQ
jgi:hypothetical protein